MAEVVLRKFVADRSDLADVVSVSSAGTARWHVGSPMDPRARAALDRAGFHGPGTTGAFADTAYLDAQDEILVMTKEHRQDVYQRLTKPVPVTLLRNVTQPGLDLDVADPYYGDDAAFDACLAQLIQTLAHWTSEFRRPPGAS